VNEGPEKGRTHRDCTAQNGTNPNRHWFAPGVYGLSHPSAKCVTLTAEVDSDESESVCSDEDLLTRKPSDQRERGRGGGWARRVREDGTAGTGPVPGESSAEAVPSAGWRAVASALDAEEGQHHE